MPKRKRPSLLLIVQAGTVELTPTVDRQGAKQHGLLERAQNLVVKAVDIQAFTSNLANSIAGAAQAVQDSVGKRLGGYAVDEISVSLAVSAEGSIGVATAGIQASIEVKLKRSK